MVKIFDMKSVTYSFVFLFISLNALADYEPKNKSGHFSGVKIGARLTTISESRGVILYNDYQLLPFLAVFAFEDRVEFLTSSISYRDFIYEDKIRFRTRLQAISDNPIFPKHESIQEIYPDREDSYEWVNRLEFFLPAYNKEYLGEIDLALHKDLKAHNGLYAELMGKTKLFTFQNELIRRSIVEPNFYFTLGYGDKRHNEYYYGASDSEGFNNFSYGLWFNFTDLADRNNPVITFKHFEVLGDKNKNANLAHNRDSGYALMFVYSHDLLK